MMTAERLLELDAELVAEEDRTKGNTRTSLPLFAGEVGERSGWAAKSGPR